MLNLIILLEIALFGPHGPDVALAQGILGISGNISYIMTPMKTKPMFKYYLLLFSLSFLFSQIVNERLYITIQMQDQIGIINTETQQIESIIETEIQNNQDINCMDYQDQMMCDMMAGCEWMMGMCMEIPDQDCMAYDYEMYCCMSDGCMWMMEMCMEGKEKGQKGK